VARHHKENAAAGEPEPVREDILGGPSNYVALAGEFFVLGELALRRLDGTLTLGHSKEVDILVLNRRTGRTFKAEVKTTEGRVRGSKLFGPHYSWLMSEKHSRIKDDDLVYCFVLLSPGAGGLVAHRIFLVSAIEVATYVAWNHTYWEDQPRGNRRPSRPSTLRQFRLPVGEGKAVVPPSWRDGRWRQWEDNWAIFEVAPDRAG
jgi:hypothetical protein